MKVIIGLIIGIMLIVLMLFGRCTRVGQTEIGFQYNVTSGKPVNEKDNPLLSFGYDGAFGINERYFVTSSEICEYTFTSDIVPTSPYNEALDWDSGEGVTMCTNFTIRGRVQDPWAFYINFGTPERNYRSVYADTISDGKVYEALRQSGKYSDMKMVELTQDMDAETIRTSRNKLKEDLVNLTRTHMQQFGFYVDDIIFPDRFQYPGGDIIDTARAEITKINTEIRKAEQELENAKAQKEVDIAEARIVAKTISEEGTRAANRVRSETAALAAELKASIDQIGPEATTSLKVAEIYSRLIEKRVIDRAYLTNTSIFAEPFYPNHVK